jgi:hypothetical protein
VREVIGVFLRGTEGASAKKRGNAVIQIFTNLPEQIDAAVMSRIQGRFKIDGAVSEQDFFDQDYLWRKKIAKVSLDFAELKDVLKGYEPLSSQVEMHSLLEFERGDVEFSDRRIGDLVVNAKRDHGDKTCGFFAVLQTGIRRLYPTFSSRDVRNIQKAVDSRLLDFDVPEKWFEDLDLFFRKSYDEKLEMIKALMRENMRGLKFAEIRFRETVKYVNAFVLIANTEFEREVSRSVKAIRVNEEARTRIANAP